MSMRLFSRLWSWLWIVRRTVYVCGNAYVIHTKVDKPLFLNHNYILYYIERKGAISTRLSENRDAYRIVYRVHNLATRVRGLIEFYLDPMSVIHIKVNVAFLLLNYSLLSHPLSPPLLFPPMPSRLLSSTPQTSPLISSPHLILFYPI